MKKSVLLLSFCMYFLNFSIAQIIHQDFGEGLTISLNENVALDINQDAEIDLYVNQYENELGFTPVFFLGCMASVEAFAFTDFGAREMQIFSQDEEIMLTNGNMFDYIDEDRGSIYSSSAGLAENWQSNEAQYVGFAIFNLDDTNEVSNGWMLVSVDTDNEVLTIHELAYTEYVPVGEGAIKAGDTGSISSNEDQELSSFHIKINPNPVYDQLNIEIDFALNQAIQVSIIDHAGKTIKKLENKSDSIYTFDSSSWTAGMYFVQITNGQESIIKKFIVQNK